MPSISSFGVGNFRVIERGNVTIMAGSGGQPGAPIDVLFRDNLWFFSRPLTPLAVPSTLVVIPTWGSNPLQIIPFAFWAGSPPQPVDVTVEYILVAVNIG